MKKVLLMFTGLSRAYSECVDNIFENLIIPNMYNYEFKIYINTQSNEEAVLYKDLEKKYNRFNQLQEIIFYNMPEKYWKERGGIGGCGCGLIQLIRCHQILEKEQQNKYDFYIMLRPDIKISSKLILDNYINTFLNVTGNFVRNGHIHNRDWEGVTVGYKDSFIVYSYLQFLHVWAFPDLQKKYKETIYYKEYNKWINKHTFDSDEIKNNCGLKGDQNIENTPNHINLVKQYYAFISYLKYKNFDYKLSEHDNIYHILIR